MKKLASIRNNQLVKLFIALFMTLNLISVIIGSLSCIYMLDVFRKAITDYNVANIENVRSMVDMRIASGEKLAQDIFLNVDLGDLSDHETLGTPQMRVLITKLIRTIQYGVDSNSVVTDAYVYLSKSDTIISNDGFFNAEFFYNNYVPHAGLTFEQWKKSIQGKREPSYVSGIHDFHSYQISVMEYHKPFNSYANDIYGCIVINYDTQAILDILKKSNLLSNASTRIRYLPTGEHFISIGDPIISDYVQKQPLIAGQYTMESTPFDKLIVIKQNSLNRDWEYISAIPTTVFYSSINTIIIIMVAVVFLQFVLGAILAFLFSGRSYQPIRRMTDKIRAMSQGMSVSDNGNDIEYIQNITSTAIDEYGKMKEELDTIKPVVMKGFLTQFLHGNALERDYASSNVAQTHDFFPQNGFICAKMYIEECSEFASEQSIKEMHLAKLVLTNIIEELFERKMTVVSLDFDLRNVVFIFNVLWTTNEIERKKYFETIESLLKKAQTVIVDHFKIYTSIGISKLNENLQSLYNSHIQANRALNDNFVSGLYGINYYTERASTQRFFTYSLEDEVYIINSVKTGDYSKVSKILEGIIGENTHFFSGNSLQAAQFFMVDLVSTLLRITEELNIPPEVMNMNVQELLSMSSYAQMVKKLYHYYNVLCEWINKNKKSHNTQLKEKILRYIEEHYLDNSLSLVSIADHLGINSTYLSVFIKEQLGETFLSYVMNLRMEKAKELLNSTDLSLQDIATQIGYANSGVFIRVFKKKYGYTPGAYRSSNDQ